MDLIRASQASGSLSPALQEALLEFVLVRQDSAHTRGVYGRACARLLRWTDHRHQTLTELRPLDLALYAQTLAEQLAPASVATHMSAIRRLYAHLMDHQLIQRNPASGLRVAQPRVQVGKTPVFNPDLLARYLDDLDLRDPRARRDHALMSAMLYSFLRIGSLLALRVGDLRLASGELLVREKGGLQRLLPLHPELRHRLQRYLANASFADDSDHALFPAMRRGRSGRYGERALSRSEAWTLVRKHLAQAGWSAPAGCHSFRATGITAFLEQGGRIETAAYLAGHASLRTTQLYDRRSRDLAGEELARMTFAREKGGSAR